MLEGTIRKSQLTTAGATVLASRLDSFAPALVAADHSIQLQHPPAEIASLLGSIQNALADRVCPIVQFMSPYSGEGAGGIAFEVALAAARQTGKRTLFINLNAPAEISFAPLASRVQVSLEAFFRAEQPQMSPLTALPGVSLFYTEFCRSTADLASAVNINFVRTLMADLREHFDFIVIASESVITGACPVAFAGLPDGVVMVVEAERTRAPVAEELKQQIETAGGRVIGAVLNRRRFYIPRWIYSLLFGRRR